jgi:SAM-dependent methyltransferase
MSAVALGQAPAERPDPFATPAGASAPRRPRLLSHLGRWGRARRWLGPGALRILDVGCAFGYGSAAIAAGAARGRTVVGVENNSEHLEPAQRDFPWIKVIDGNAERLPVRDGCADAVLLLDVIEHLADPSHAISEARRVLRPGGTVIVSVPHRGLLHRLDALNVYSALRRRRPSWPPLEPATGSAGGVHRHFRVRDLRALMEPQFEVRRMTRTGLGLEELVYLAALLARVPSGRERVRRPILILHLLLYLLDDAVAWGPLGYNLTMLAQRTDSPA